MPRTHHHCPGCSKESKNYKKKCTPSGMLYCPIHQVYCPKNANHKSDDIPHLKNEQCRTCVREEKKRVQQQHDQARKVQEEAERRKKEAAKSQSAKDKAPLSKKVKTRR